MKVEIWFEFASTYSYLTACRAPALLRQAGVEYAWMPFLLGPIFQDHGFETSPFLLYPTKGAYMWRDLERRAARFGLPFVRPPIFPMNGLKAARSTTASLSERWSGGFAQAVFAAQFVRGENISDVGVLSAALATCGVDPAPWLARAQTDAVKAELRTRTDRARRNGIFGAPSFVVGDELFWGDDRLEDAIACASGQRAGACSA